MRAISSSSRQNSLSTALSWPAFVLPWLLICVAWAIVLFAFATDRAFLFNHDYLLRASHLPWGLALLLFLPGWQIMFAAMMLPSSFSAFTALAAPACSWRELWRRQVLFLVGYALMWSVFALVAFLGDTVLHALVERWRWLALHSWLIGMWVLLLAGIFQLLPLKQRSLRACCASSARAMVGTAWGRGVRYGRDCLGSCWALMLVMVALGMQSLAVLALLAALMLIEKELPGGTRLRPWIGGLFLGLALFTVVWPLLPGI